MVEKTFATSTIVSLSDVMLSSRPKGVVEDALVKLLVKRLKALDIIWDPPTFRRALKNPKLPAELLAKLENLVVIAESSGWDVSVLLRQELSDAVEDIESYNPAYRAWLKKSRKESLREIKEGRFATTEELIAKYGIK